MEKKNKTLDTERCVNIGILYINKININNIIITVLLYKIGKSRESLTGNRTGESEEDSKGHMKRGNKVMKRNNLK